MARRNAMSQNVVQLDRRNSCSEAEWQTRIDLAACYRLVAQYGWDDLVFTHISARVPGGHEHFLVNRYGLMFEEMTASSLVKVGLDGTVIDDDPQRSEEHTSDIQSLMRISYA